MADKTLNVRIRTKHDTEANWTTNNPVLLDGEQGFVTGTTKYKIGDGTKKWSELSYHNTLTDSEKTKLSGIATEANKTVVDSALSSTSTNPVQNKVINSALEGKAPKSHEHNYIKNNPYEIWGTAEQAGYVLFAQLKITEQYTNKPIEFELIQRGKSTPCYVSLQFLNKNSNDPGLSSICYFGTDYGVFIQKTNTSTWALYARKSGSYDVVTVARVQTASDGIEITYPGGVITEKPTSNVIDATLGWNVGAAAKLGRDGDTSNPMTFHWVGQIGQPNWLWGGNDGNSMYIYNPSNFNVASAEKLTASAGSATKPVYFSDGKPKECTYTLEKSVPSNAVFTDSHYVTNIYAGASETASNSSATSPYIKIADNSAYRNQVRLIGSGGTTVSSDSSGNITIKSTGTEILTQTTEPTTQVTGAIWLKSTDMTN